MSLARMTATVVAFLLVAAACSGTGGSQLSQAPASVSISPAVTPTSTAPGSSPVASPAPGATITVEAVDSAFDVKTIEAPANSTFKVTLNNTGELPHDIAFYDKEGGSPLAESAVSPIIQGGETATITFTTPGAGTYFFVCLVHPQEMTGSFVVR